MNPQHNELNYDLNRLRLQDQLRQAAEHQRQVEQLQMEEHPGALNTLGRQMVKLGEWLQNQ
ncbi:MAG TPA: hypothetical protein VHL11_06395 [Phototrophicaceae bacterium]|jgi:uncharacterized protein HemY|nr:hypothetical protein [Phototrophicaceae bacterium]